MAGFLNMKVFISWIILIMLLTSITDAKKKKEQYPTTTVKPNSYCDLDLCSKGFATYVTRKIDNFPTTNVCLCCARYDGTDCSKVDLTNDKDMECKISKPGERCYEVCKATNKNLVKDYMCGGKTACYCGV